MGHSLKDATFALFFIAAFGFFKALVIFEVLAVDR